MDSSSDRGLEDDLDLDNEFQHTPLSDYDAGEATKQSAEFDAAKFEHEAQQALKSQILILCSALGGADDTGKYVLGADALACLKDIKRWIKVVDDASDSWNVASACDDNGLVVNDLVPILVQLPARAVDANRAFYHNILLAALELLVALTRPLVLDTERASAAKIDLYIKLKKSHVRYKDRILNYEAGRCLKSVVGLTIPILSTPRDQRSPKDTVILNLCLNLFRNVLRIEPADATVGTRRSTSKTQQVNDNMPHGVSREDISFSHTVCVFRENKVLRFVQTITAGLGREFDERVLGTVCLDTYFYLLYGLDPATVAVQPGDGARGGAATVLSLGSALEHEKLLKKKLLSNNVTRHANFGTLLSIRQGDEPVLTVSGQKRLIHADLLDQLDAGVSKKAVATRHTTNKNESTRSDFDRRLGAERAKQLSRNAHGVVREFCTDFVEAGFGPLLRTMRRVVLGERTPFAAFVEFHFFYLVAWVLKYERLLREHHAGHVFRLGYVQDALSYDMLRLVVKNSLPLYVQNREHSLLRVAVGCFREMLLTVVDMHRLRPEDYAGLSPEQQHELDAYTAAAEQLLRLTFSAEDDIEVLFHVIHDAHKVSLAHALDMIEHTHVLLKVLQYLADLPTPLAMGRKRRGRPQQQLDSDSDSMDDARLKRYLQFDRARYEVYERKLLHERAVACYVSVFAKFGELSELQMRRCISYFNRIMLKKDEHFLKLLRLDFMLALHDVKDAVFGPAVMRDLGRLLGHYMHTLEKKWAQTDAVLLDLLTLGQDHDRGVRAYLETGNLEEWRAREHAQRGADVAFATPGLSYSHKVSVLASALVYRDHGGLLETLAALLRTRGDDELVLDDRAALRSGVFRLLLATVGFRLAPGRAVLPRDADAGHVTAAVELLEQARERPLESHEVEAELVEERQEQREQPAEDTARFDDLGSDNDLETLNRVSESIDRLDVLEAALEKNTGKRRRDPEADDVRFAAAGRKRKGRASRTARRKSAPKHEEPKQHLSSKYVDSDDDASDAEKEAEFFRREEQLQALIQANGGVISPEQFQRLLGGGGQQRTMVDLSENEESSLSGSESETSTQQSRVPARRGRAVIDEDEDE
ncbi:hypothetical protein KL937_000687 [Ogataea polymorpha]|nr:hypothetical protein KL937_000687 [Ogataea polymorpha]KAG7939746.1 hypothetical protein KL904_000684 [Ogataea polymorpha]